TQAIPPLRLPHSDKRGLEQRADDAERELPLEVTAPRVQDFHPGCRSPPARGGEESRLADAGAALDQDETPCPLSRGIDECTKLRQLTFALEQIGCCRHSGPFLGPQSLRLFLGVVLIAKASPQFPASPQVDSEKRRRP